LSIKTLPLAVVRWNSHKRYLVELAQAAQVKRLTSAVSLQFFSMTPGAAVRVEYRAGLRRRLCRQVR